MMCQRSSVSATKEKREYESVRVRGRLSGGQLQELGFTKGRWEDTFCFVLFFFCFFFLNYYDFLLKPVVNLITYNILRRFFLIVLECMS